MNLCRTLPHPLQPLFIYCLPLNVFALSSRDIEVIALVAEGTDSLSTADGLIESGSPKSVSNVNIV